MNRLALLRASIVLSTVGFSLVFGCSTQVQTGPDAPPDLAVVPIEVGDFALPPADLATAPPDLRSVEDLGKPVGASCSGDADCTSGACRKVGSGGSSICVGRCRAQTDCDALPGSVTCQPEKAGDASGLCLPPSPNHCASCDKDSDCGGLAERCLIGTGDTAPACHLDCSLSATVCPADYDCAQVDDGGKPRKLCLPKTKLCVDSLGGYCDRVALPQLCGRKNDAGQCSGQRACLAGGRYDRCGAPVPQWKKCGDMDPPGCMLKLAADAVGSKQNCARCGDACGGDEDCCGGSCKKVNTISDCGACGKSCAMGSGCCAGACTALDTVQNCGMCGNACPGQGLSNNDVYCDAMKRSCGMSCRGDNYDVDKSAANGCEILDVLPPGHTESSASGRGSRDCNDTASRDTFGAGVPSDEREHKNPPVVSFSGTVGAAPDFWSVRATGGILCVNDYEVTFSTFGGSASSCYTLTIQTNKKTESLTINGSTWGRLSSGSGSYSGGSDIFFKIEKTCTSPMPENVSYTVDYHL